MTMALLIKILKLLISAPSRINLFLIFFLNFRQNKNMAAPSPPLFSFLFHSKIVI